jgi:hypothetical protein
MDVGRIYLVMTRVMLEHPHPEVMFISSSEHGDMVKCRHCSMALTVTTDQTGHKALEYAGPAEFRPGEVDEP